MLQANEIYVGAAVCLLREGKPFCNTTITQMFSAKERTVTDIDGNSRKVSEPVVFVKGYDFDAVPLAELIPHHRAWREIKFIDGVAQEC